MRLGAPLVLLLAACVQRPAVDGYRHAEYREGGCFLMQERHDTRPGSPMREPRFRVLLEQYERRGARGGEMWFYTDSASPRWVMWGGWLRQRPDTVEAHSSTYPSVFYRLTADGQGALSGRGGMERDALAGGRVLAGTWAVHLEPMECAVLSR